MFSFGYNYGGKVMFHWDLGSRYIICGIHLISKIVIRVKFYIRHNCLVQVFQSKESPEDAKELMHSLDEARVAYK